MRSQHFRLAVLACSALVAAGCSTSAAGTAATPSPSAGGTQTREDGYVSRPETAEVRGDCPEGYAYQNDAPDSSYGCVYDSFSPDPVKAVLGKGYPFRVHNHCGVRVEQFDDRVFVADRLYPSGAGPEGGRDPFGTMTLTDEGTAKFQGRIGYVVTLHAASPLPKMAGCD